MNRSATDLIPARDLHPCAAWHCGARIPRHLLMCPDDWALVPRAVQDRVVRTYRRRRQDGWGPYAAAIADARQAVTQALGRPTPGIPEEEL